MIPEPTLSVCPEDPGVLDSLRIHFQARSHLYSFPVENFDQASELLVYLSENLQTASRIPGTPKSFTQTHRLRSQHPSTWRIQPHPDLEKFPQSIDVL